MNPTETTHRLRAILVAAFACIILFPSVARGDELQIRTALNEANINVSRLRVVEAEGIVIVHGQVQRREQILRVTNLIQGLGYRRVAAMLIVTPLPDDDAIALSAERQLSLNRSLEGSRLTVRSTDGVVTIGGTVDSELQADLARQIVARVDGVREVRTQLQEI